MSGYVKGGREVLREKESELGLIKVDFSRRRRRLKSYGLENKWWKGKKFV